MESRDRRRGFVNPNVVRAMFAQRPFIRRRLLATHALNSKARSTAPVVRHDWKRQEIQGIYDSPLMDLVFRAATVHRSFQDPTKIQLCTLMNIKSMIFLIAVMLFFYNVVGLAAGGCSEDCTNFLLDNCSGTK